MPSDTMRNIADIRDPGKTIEVLFKISNAVTKTRNLNELYRVIHKNLGKILNVDNFYIALLDQEKDRLWFPYYVDQKNTAPEEITDFSKAKSSVGMVISCQSPMLFYANDILRLHPSTVKQSLSDASKIWLGAPLVIDNRVMGAMVLQSYQSESDYKKEDLDLLYSVSQHVALAIERKETEDKLSEQGSVLGAILESSPVGIALLQNRVFKWVNNEMVSMFGYDSKADLENKSTRMIYINDDVYNRTGETIYEGLTTSGTADYESNLVKKDQTLFPAHIRLNSKDLSNPMEWTIATFTDLSLRKAAEKDVVEKERLQGVLELAGAVCHEINQPLQAILGHTELLMLDASKEDAHSKGIKAINQQAKRLGKITRKLSEITHYRTVEYTGNTKIVDIWNAGMEKGD